MTRRRLIALILAIGSLTGAWGQGQVITDANRRGLPNLPAFDQRRIHFGFLIGLNALDFHIYNTGLRTDENGQIARFGEIIHLNPGINLGIVTDLRLTDHLNLRALPGVGFGERDITFIDEHGKKLGDPLKIKSTFVEVPLLAKYGANRLKNVKPYVVAGTTPRFDLAKDKQDHLLLRSLDAYVDAGAGMDFYLPYFRFSIELRGSIGLTNVYDDTPSSEYEDIPYQQAIKRLKSRMICLTFYFE